SASTRSSARSAGRAGAGIGGMLYTPGQSKSGEGPWRSIPTSSTHSWGRSSPISAPGCTRRSPCSAAAPAPTKRRARRGRLTSPELAKKTGTSERYLREWLNAMAAGGYVSYDAAANKYFLSDEQAFTLADETSPAYLPGAFQVISAVFHGAPKIADAFRSGN